MKTLHQDMNSALEQRVKERTSALQRAFYEVTNEKNKLPRSNRRGNYFNLGGLDLSPQGGTPMMFTHSIRGRTNI